MAYRLKVFSTSIAYTLSTFHKLYIFIPWMVVTARLVL